MAKASFTPRTLKVPTAQAFAAELAATPDRLLPSRFPARAYGLCLLPCLMALLPVPGGGTVKIVEQGAGPPVVLLHSGVGSAGEWREVFSLSRVLVRHLA